MFRRILLGGVVALLGHCVAAQASEVLVNGDFQSGLTGWSSYTTANGTITAVPSTPGFPVTPQVAAVASFNTTGSGASSALFLNAGKAGPIFGLAPEAGGGVTQTFTTTGGLASFSADIAFAWLSQNASFALGTMSVLLDGNVLDSTAFPAVGPGPVTLRDTLDFSIALAAGQHTLSIQSTRLFGPSINVAAQYFDNVSLDVVTPAVPEPSTWAMMILGFAGVGFMAYRRRSQLRVV
ncbi:MAG: PEPxxWA-CTERM sorting domain-containing protein [Bradyrhizobium sp.]|nr:PEPxxWA-CTERM sorting domain-containing protein [Bradyrhizobium sp.]